MSNSVLKLVNGIPRMQIVSVDDVEIYDETILVDTVIETGTPITLLNSGTYNGDELEVRLNGQRLESLIDYNYVGSAPRTQIEMTFDLEPDDKLRFRVDRKP
jgi:hypothetical protein